jgi:hypothetical protein
VCLDVLRAQGLGTTNIAMCDLLLFLDAAYDRAGDTGPGSLRRGIDLVGSSYASASTFDVDLGPGRRDGAATLRYFTYDAGCACFAYV